jgi:hypothetical protein
MTYLEIVNKVLRLMREDTIASVINPDDYVAALVTEFVNDAKRFCEEAHNWNQLRAEWTITTADGTDEYSLTDAGKYAKIEDIYSATYALRKVQYRYMTRLKTTNPSSNPPRDWAVSGTDASGDVTLKLYPTPNDVYNITVFGFQRQPDLALDDDQLLIPDQPVVYRALALALRERGEVGGQTAAEIFAVAQQHLNDAIARDADMAHLDFIWHQV